jgi:hypothetical protein
MSSSILRDLREQRRVEDEEIKRERAWEEAHIAEIDREFQISLQQSRQRSKNLSPEYWVSFTPIRGDDVEYGPFAKASEAKEVFEHTFPAFDGGDCCLYKLESHEGISPEELRKGAYQEQCQDDPYGRGYTRIVNKATTVLARDEWESSCDHGEVYWTHAGKAIRASDVLPLYLAARQRNPMKSSRSELQGAQRSVILRVKEPFRNRG